jgi:hypothetical protein
MFRFAHVFVALGLLLFVAGCGGNSAPDPTPTATTVPSPTVGELADMIAAAWSGVSTYRAVSQNVELIGTPAAASPAGLVQPDIVTEVVLPDIKRQQMITNGTVNAEIVIVGSDVFVRGWVSEGLAPVEDGWTEVDPETLNPEFPLAMQIAALMAPSQPPYSGLSEDERNRAARPLGEIVVNGQSCQAYRIADTTDTGERVDVTLAINSDDLPCSIQTKVSGVNYVTRFEFNIALTITAPIINIQPFQ